MVFELTEKGIKYLKGDVEEAFAEIDWRSIKDLGKLMEINELNYKRLINVLSAECDKRAPLIKTGVDNPDRFKIPRKIQVLIFYDSLDEDNRQRYSGDYKNIKQFGRSQLQLLESYLVFEELIGFQF